MKKLKIFQEIESIEPIQIKYFAKATGKLISKDEVGYLLEKNARKLIVENKLNESVEQFEKALLFFENEEHKSKLIDCSKCIQSGIKGIKYLDNADYSGANRHFNAACQTCDSQILDKFTAKRDFCQAKSKQLNDKCKIIEKPQNPARPSKVNPEESENLIHEQKLSVETEKYSEEDTKNSQFVKVKKRNSLKLALLILPMIWSFVFLSKFLSFFYILAILFSFILVLSASQKLFDFFIFLFLKYFDLIEASSSLFFNLLIKLNVTLNIKSKLLELKVIASSVSKYILHEISKWSINSILYLVYQLKRLDIKNNLLKLIESSRECLRYVLHKILEFSLLGISHVLYFFRVLDLQNKILILKESLVSVLRYILNTTLKYTLYSISYFVHLIRILDIKNKLLVILKSLKIFLKYVFHKMTEYLSYLFRVLDIRNKLLLLRESLVVVSCKILEKFFDFVSNLVLILIHFYRSLKNILLKLNENLKMIWNLLDLKNRVIKICKILFNSFIDLSLVLFACFILTLRFITIYNIPYLIYLHCLKFFFFVIYTYSNIAFQLSYFIAYIIRVSLLDPIFLNYLSKVQKYFLKLGFYFFSFIIRLFKYAAYLVVNIKNPVLFRSIPNFILYLYNYALFYQLGLYLLNIFKYFFQVVKHFFNLIFYLSSNFYSRFYEVIQAYNDRFQK